MSNIIDSEEFFSALDLLDRALDFYDRVVASPEEERLAVGRDHYDWVFRAARSVVSFSSSVQKGEIISNIDTSEIVSNIDTSEIVCKYCDFDKYVYYDAFIDGDYWRKCMYCGKETNVTKEKKGDVKNN